MLPVTQVVLFLTIIQKQSQASLLKNAFDPRRIYRSPKTKMKSIIVILFVALLANAQKSFPKTNIQINNYANITWTYSVSEKLFCSLIFFTKASAGNNFNVPLKIDPFGSANWLYVSDNFYYGMASWNGFPNGVEVYLSLILLYDNLFSFISLVPIGWS